MKTKQKLITLLVVLTINVHAQDSSLVRPARPEKPHEFGVGILAPMIVLAGSGINWDQYTNLTYRYRMTETHATRFFVGAGSKNNSYPDPIMAGQIVSTGTPAYYRIRNTTRPSNFQAGIGYEYIFGSRLKKVVGADIVYNNVFEKEEHYYVKLQDSVASGLAFTNYTRIDTGNTVRTRNYDKAGLNLNFSFRYDFARRWVATGTLIAAFRYSRFSRNGGSVSNFDLNIAPIGDISVFYKF